MLWHFRFMKLAKCVSEWSKDPRTHIGCVIVKNKRVIATGYNGLPSRIDDTEERLMDREVKNSLTIHAEVNAILNATTSLDGATMYIYGLPPCLNCIKTILNTGIKEIYYRDDGKPHNPEWQEQFEYAKHLLKEAGIYHAFI